MYYPYYPPYTYDDIANRTTGPNPDLY
ncbi:Protein of unknown function [Bacillus wiedmannii]|nr:Protein of unknown function [Bacillus wiedmannii]